MTDKVFGVEVQKEFDVLEKKWDERVFVKFYLAARTSGLLAQISDRDFKTLVVLATYMDKDGNCYPSQKEIAKALGCDMRTAGRRIRSLLKFWFKGEKIVNSVKIRNKNQQFKNTRYTILPVTNLQIFSKDGENNPSSEPEDTFASRQDLSNPSSEPEDTFASRQSCPTNKNQCFNKNQNNNKEVVFNLNNKTFSEKESEIMRTLTIEKVTDLKKQELKNIIKKYNNTVLNDSLKVTVKDLKAGKVKTDSIRYLSGVCKNMFAEYSKKQQQEIKGKEKRVENARLLKKSYENLELDDEKVQELLNRNFGKEIIKQI
ncbi:helix-turn-helix domain-containing protein [Candidatus Oleimmundimicrobium sp.]|uniref:helix-turn-helix domain-containing protein n=1 Tax=Candidatus Oleimmundimicrobium sp. TaxID=3060597 RepID=UPI0027163D5C|nr:helix-turn-helix domain-containing protein [Candidatus Oleimmundimicrobium sp.]MDO8886684.1 helix-turn-helix domain-containing protein [Candidatus Oleimmundimicrobium sp.]